MVHHVSPRENGINLFSWKLVAGSCVNIEKRGGGRGGGEMTGKGHQRLPLSVQLIACNLISQVKIS